MHTHGHIIESGAHALSCAVIPAGIGDIDEQVEAIHHLKPTAYCGDPERLKALLERGASLNRDVSSIRKALVSNGPLTEQMRKSFAFKGISVRQAYMTSDLGVVAYETTSAEGVLAEGMVVNEGLILEIVRTGSSQPLPPGEIGEIVVTRLNADFPLVRFATGDLSMILNGPSPCGRTNLRIKGCMGHVNGSAMVHGKLIHAHQIAQVQKIYPNLQRMRMVVMKMGARDALFLQVEAQRADAALINTLAETVRDILELDTEIDVFVPGTLPHDGRLLVDERT